MAHIIKPGIVASVIVVCAALSIIGCTIRGLDPTDPNGGGQVGGVIVTSPEITGTVRDAGGQGVSGVTVSCDNGGGSAVTDELGRYALAVPSGWSGNITPSDGVSDFDPLARHLDDVDDDVSAQDFSAEDFTPADAVAMLQSLPTYSGGPRIMLQINGGYWDYDPEGRAILLELMRVCGTLTVWVTRADLGMSGSKRVARAIEAAAQGTPIWLETGGIGGLGAYKAIESYDPNYLHETPEPLENYVITDHTDTRRSRWLACPGRLAMRRQIARTFAAGLEIRNAGLDAEKVTGIWVHDETVYVAGYAGEYYVYDRLYEACAYCGSPAEHNRRLAELQADILHALLRGLGAVPPGDLNRDGIADDLDLAVYQEALVTQDPIADYNNDGQVNADDLAFLAELPVATPKDIKRFWWSGGWRWDAEKDRYQSSPWLPIEAYPDTPMQSFAGFSNYFTDGQALTTLTRSIEQNLSALGKQSVPFLSLTYDGTALSELGVDPELNRQKAGIAAAHNCPLIGCYALNPPREGWWGRTLFRNEFECVRAIVEGCRPQ